MQNVKHYEVGVLKSTHDKTIRWKSLIKYYNNTISVQVTISMIIIIIEVINNMLLLLSSLLL